MHQKPNILGVCGRNKRRSRTAEYLFKNDSRFNIRSVGLSPKSPRTINERDIQWASLIFVMDDDQAKRITATYRNSSLPKVQVLHIDDVYEYLDPELIELLNDRIITTLTSEKYL
jgi:protein-tyrosine phosphatase